MLPTPLQSSIVVFPCIGVTRNPNALPDAIEYVASIVEHTPTELHITVYRDGREFDMVIGPDGRVLSSDIEKDVGVQFFLQWQGHRMHHTSSGDFGKNMMDHAQVQVRSGHTGPLDVDAFIKSPRLTGVAYGDLMQRVRVLDPTGDLEIGEKILAHWLVRNPAA